MRRAGVSQPRRMSSGATRPWPRSGIARPSPPPSVSRPFSRLQPLFSGPSAPSRMLERPLTSGRRGHGRNHVQRDGAHCKDRVDRSLGRPTRKSVCPRLARQPPVQRHLFAGALLHTEVFAQSSSKRAASAAAGAVRRLTLRGAVPPPSPWSGSPGGTSIAAPRGLSAHLTAHFPLPAGARGRERPQPALIRVIHLLG